MPIFELLLSHSTFWFEFNSLVRKVYQTFGESFAFYRGNENEFQLPSSPSLPANFPTFLLFPPSDKKSINLHSCMFRIDSAPR